MLWTATAGLYCTPRRDVGILELYSCCFGRVLMSINLANRTVAELALKNDQAEVVKFISEYKANSNNRNKLTYCSRHRRRL